MPAFIVLSRITSGFQAVIFILLSAPPQRCMRVCVLHAHVELGLEVSLIPGTIERKESTDPHKLSSGLHKRS